MPKISFPPASGRIRFLVLAIGVLSQLGLPAGLWADGKNSFADGRLFLADGQAIDHQALAARAAGADYVLIGETHDSPHHHLMQAELLAVLAEAGLRPVVGFEMLYSRNQNLLEPFNRRQIKVEALEAASGWSQSWSYPFAIYAPIFQVAERFDLPVYGLNISKATLDLVRAAGSFEAALAAIPEADRPDLPRELIWPLPKQVERLTRLREESGQWWTGGSGDQKGADSASREAAGQPARDKDPSGGPAKAGDSAGPAKVDPQRYLMVQSLWDTSMAESAARARRQSGRPVVIIAGSGHVEHGQGIAHRLRQLDPDGKILLVMPLAHPFQGDDDERRAAGDVFFASRPSVLSLGLVFKSEAERILVDEVAAGSRAEAAGLQVGDRLLEFENKPLKSPGGFHSAVAVADLLDKRAGREDRREKPLLVERTGRRLELNLR